MLKRNITEQSRKKTKGQSTVEYIILVAAVIGALIIFLPGTFKTAYEGALNSTTNVMADMSDRYGSSIPTE